MIRIQIDIDEHENEYVEARAKEWRLQQIKDLCEDCGFPKAAIHSEGADILPGSWVMRDGSEDMKTCLRLLWEEMEELADKWNRGDFDDEVRESLFCETIQQEY